MGQYNIPPDLTALFKDIQTRLRSLANAQKPQVYTTATRPPASQVTQGVIIFVTDGAAGSRFQGWNGAAWVSLG